MGIFDRFFKKRPLPETLRQADPVTETRPDSKPLPVKEENKPDSEPMPVKEENSPDQKQKIIETAFDHLEQFQRSYTLWKDYLYNKDRRPDGTMHFTAEVTPEERRLENAKNSSKNDLLRSFRQLTGIPEPETLSLFVMNFDFSDSFCSHKKRSVDLRYKDLYDLLIAARKALEDAENKQAQLYPEVTAPAEETISEPAPAEIETPSEYDMPAYSSETEAWDSTDSLNSSISMSISKDSMVEELDPPGTAVQMIIRDQSDSISNESITRYTRILDTYEVQTDAIRGGMGSVWKVHHNNWNVDLAMKRPQPKFFAEGSQQRKDNFIHECDAWIRLGLHPNIVSCYYVREIGGVPTIFSEWMENGSLENRIEDGSLYEGEDGDVQARLLDIAIQFARGLHYAHESEDRLIHQDVKPDNLLLTKEWDAKVADFGLARARLELLQTTPEHLLSESADDTSEHAAGATHMAPTGGYTPAYCSEEQLLGEKLSRRTDIYSWAVSVLEMYLGKRPWKQGVEAGRNCGQYFADARVFMPESLKELLSRCLKKEAEERPHDFSIIEEALKQIYRETCGTAYPREASKAAADTADSLNNRALSYLDLGKTAEAEKFWKDALEKTPNHLRSIYNQGLYQWRKDIIDDEELLRRLTEAGQADAARKLYEQICGERGISEDTQARESLLFREWKGFPGTYTLLEFLPCITVENSLLYMSVSRRAREGETGDRHRTVYEILCIDANTWNVLFCVRGRGCIRLSDDQQTLFFCSEDKMNLLITEASSGKELRRLSCTAMIKGFCLHPDRQHCFVSTEQQIMKFDLMTCQCESSNMTAKYTLNTLHAASGLRFTDDGRYLYEAGDLFLKYDSKSLQVIRAARIDAAGIFNANNVFISRNAEKLYSTDTSGIFYSVPGVYEREYYVDQNYYDWLKKQPLPEIFPLRNHMLLKSRGHNDILWMNEAESRMLVETTQGRLKLYDMETKHCLCTWFGPEQNIIDASSDQDCKEIICGYKDSSVKVFRGQLPVKAAPWELSVVESFARVREKQERINRFVKRIGDAIEADDLRQAVSLLKEAETEEGEGGSSRIRALRHRLSGLILPEQVDSVFQAGSLKSKAGSYSSTGFIAVSPKNRSLVKRLKDNLTQLEIWNDNLEKAKTIELRDQGEKYRGGYSVSMQFSSTGRYLVSGIQKYSGDGSYIAIWDLENADEEKDITGLPYNLSRIALSPDNALILAGGSEGFAAVYDRSNLSCKKILTECKSDIVDVCFVKNGKWACTADYDGNCRLYDTESFECIRTLTIDEMYINSMTPDPSGQKLYFNTSKRGVVSVWDMDHCCETASFQTDQRSSLFMAIDPKGRIMAVSGWGDDGIIKLWRLSDYTLLHTIQSNESFIDYLTFSADGCTLYASCRGDVLMWEIRWNLT